MSPLRKWLNDKSDVALCAVRKWWRPLVCLSIGGGLFVNGILLPIMTKSYPDLVGMAACIAAAAPFAWLRTQEKIKGVDAPKPTPARTEQDPNK